jgi:hypothetical protein
MKIECLIKSPAGLKVVADGNTYDLPLIPFFEEHYFTPSENDSNFCGKCGKYLTHQTHFSDRKTEEFEGGDLFGIDEVLEALGYLLNSYKADFKTITGADLNDTHAVKFAKHVLAKHPKPRTNNVISFNQKTTIK